MSSRKSAILEGANRIASERQDYRRRAAFFHGEDMHYLRFLIPEGLRVLEIGCGTGDTPRWRSISFAPPASSGASFALKQADI